MRFNKHIPTKSCLLMTGFAVFTLILFPPSKTDAQAVPGTPGDNAKLVIEPSGDGITNYFSDGEISGCATDTWTAMVNQAVAQTRRETAFNKRFIVKSDSVLQYSCFSDTIANTVNAIDPIFTASDRWKANPVNILGDEDVLIEIYDRDPETEVGYYIDFLSENTLEESLILVVDSAFKNYINGQFNHNYISGTAPVSGTGLEPCTNMAEIWKAAKCVNFGGTIPFPTFEELAKGYEPRQFPSGSGWDCTAQ